MIIDCISDLHGFFPKLPGGDLLIVAGDLTAHDRVIEHMRFSTWLSQQQYRKKVYIAGNHDSFMGKNRKESIVHPTCDYLCDSGTEFEGLKIWGSPWTKRFVGMNPHCMAFTVDTDEELAEKWALIPEDTNILITHSPPYSHLDFIPSTYKHLGSVSLRQRIREIKPRLCVFGHIHECGGNIVDFADIKYVNASHVEENYIPIHDAMRVIL